MPSTRRGGRSGPRRAAKPAIIPAWVEPVTVQTTIVSKKTPSSCSCCGDLEGPVGEAEAAERVLGGARPGSRTACRRPPRPRAMRVLPRAADADVEAGRVEPHVGAHDPRQQDVADLVVDRVVPVDPPLLDQPALQAQLGRDGRDLPGVVGLDAADRDQRVRPLGQCVRDDVLELAGLVAAEGEPRVAVLALGPDGRAAEVLR